MAAENADLALSLFKLRYTALNEGHDKGNSMAKAELWLETDKFCASAANIQDEILKLNAAARTGSVDNLNAAFGPTGVACKACAMTLVAKSEHVSVIALQAATAGLFVWACMACLRHCVITLPVPSRTRLIGWTVGLLLAGREPHSHLMNAPTNVPTNAPTYAPTIAITSCACRAVFIDRAGSRWCGSPSS